MDVFDEVNRRSASGESEFRILFRGDGRLVLIGSFDLDYYHDFEVTFHDVLESDCPEELRWPRFRDGGATGEHRRYVIEDDEGRYEVVARDVSVEVGKVFHYDRGALLKPGERIAPWVGQKRPPTGGEREEARQLRAGVLGVLTGVLVGLLFAWWLLT
jgi:hypothetical protein